MIFFLPLMWAGGPVRTRMWDSAFSVHASYAPTDGCGSTPQRHADLLVGTPDPRGAGAPEVTQPPGRWAGSLSTQCLVRPGLQGPFPFWALVPKTEPPLWIPKAPTGWQRCCWLLMKQHSTETLDLCVAPHASFSPREPQFTLLYSGWWGRWPVGPWRLCSCPSKEAWLWGVLTSTLWWTQPASLHLDHGSLSATFSLCFTGEQTKALELPRWDSGKESAC